jgi:hypothetical protein
MKKQEIVRINEKMGTYATRDSQFGSDKRRNHPLFTPLHPIPVSDIQEGDIVRCDGLPFLAKPAIIYSTQFFHKKKLYEPCQLTNLMWVLRKVK